MSCTATILPLSTNEKLLLKIYLAYDKYNQGDRLSPHDIEYQKNRLLEHRGSLSGVKDSLTALYHKGFITAELALTELGASYIQESFMH